MSGRPARTPGSRMARRGEEETESTRNFSRPANTPLRECWHLDRHFSTPTYPTQLIGTLVTSSPHPPGQLGQVLLPHGEVFQVGQGKQLVRRKLDVTTVNFF